MNRGNNEVPIPHNSDQAKGADLLHETCPLHAGRKLDYLCVDSRQSSVFKCMFCVTDEDVSQYSLIPLSQVVEAKEKTIFANYPLTDRAFTREIRQIVENPSTGEVIKKNIQEYFKDLKAKFLFSIDNIESRMVAKAQSISDLSSEITSLYNSLSEKKKLQEILSNINIPFSEKSTEIKSICIRVMRQESQNKSTMQAAIEKVAQLNSTIDFEKPKLIKEQLLKDLDSIDMFLVEDIANLSENLRVQRRGDLNSNQTISDLMKLVKNPFNGISDEASKKFEKQLKQMNFVIRALEVPVAGRINLNLEYLNANQTTVISNLVQEITRMNKEEMNQQMFQNINNNDLKVVLKPEAIYELISNQVNSCSSEYLSEISRIMNNIGGLLGLFKVPKLCKKTNENEIFNRMKPEQLSNLAKLASKIYQQNGLNHQQNGELSSSLLAEKLIKIPNISKYNNLNQIKQLLADYPIFNLIQIDLQLGKQIPIQFQNWNQNDSFTINIEQLEDIVELSIPQGKRGQCLSQLLDSQKGYCLKIGFNRPFGIVKDDQFNMGLLSDSDSKHFWFPKIDNSSGFVSTPCENDQGIKLIRGAYLTSQTVRNKTSALEFRWCTQQKLFFISDENYENICQVEEQYFNPTLSYRFVIKLKFLKENDWQITINEFTEIDPSEVRKFN